MRAQGFTGEPGGCVAKASQTTQLCLTLNRFTPCLFLIQSVSKEWFPLNSVSSNQRRLNRKNRQKCCLLLIHLITSAASEPLGVPSLLTQNHDREQEARRTGERRKKDQLPETLGKSQGFFSRPSPHWLVQRKLCPIRPAREHLLDDGTEAAGASWLSHTWL